MSISDPRVFEQPAGEGQEVQHTPEPWGLDDADKRQIPAIYAGHDLGIDDTEPLRPYVSIAEPAWKSCTHEEACANARRIVACVNACRGISTETLERRPVQDVATDAYDHIARLHAALSWLHEMSSYAADHLEEGWASKGGPGNTNRGDLRNALAQANDALQSAGGAK